MTITRFAPASTAVSFAEIEAHEFKHIQDIITAPAPSGGDDSKAIEEAYEELGKSGIIQLRKGTYKFDAGVKFRKWAVWLRGMGAAGEEVESKLLNAGTMITCNSKNKPAIECSIPGTRFSDFAILNNTSTELGTLSEALSSSGAAITELPVNELAEAIPNKTKIKTLSGSSLLVLGTLNKELKTTEEVTEITVNALAGAIPATNTKGKTKITLHEGVNTQVITMTAEAASGATKIKVEKFKPNFNYPITTTKVEGANFFQNWVLTAEAAAKATKIKVESLKPNFSYPATTTTIEGGPFPGSLGILANTSNAAGEEGKTEGNCRGKYTDVDFEGFYENVRINGGRTQNFTRCKFNGHVQYGLRLGDPIFFDAGEHEIFNCWFCATKQRTPVAHIEWESGGGVMVADSTFIFNPENELVNAITEYCVDFTENIGKAFSTSEINVHNNEFEGFTKTGVRVQNTIAGEQIQSIIVSNNNFRSFFANATCLAVESAFAGNFKGIAANGNIYDPEGGTCMKFKNATPFNTAGCTSFGSVGHWIVLEGESATITSYPPTTATPILEVVNKARSGLGINYFLVILQELFPGEELPFALQYSTTEAAGKLTEAKTLGTFRLKVPPNAVYGYVSEETKGTITALKTKALNLYVPTETKIRLSLASNRLINDELTTSAAALPGGTPSLLTSYLTTELKAAEKVTVLKTKALNFTVLKGARVMVYQQENKAAFTEFEASATALVGATEIKVTEATVGEALAINSPVEVIGGPGVGSEIKVVEKTLANGPYPANEGQIEAFTNSEKLTVQAGPVLIPGGYKYEIERLDGLTKEVKIQKYAAP